MLEGGCGERSLCWACMPLSWELWTKTHSQKYLLTLSATKIRTAALKKWHFKKIRVRAGGVGRAVSPQRFFFFSFYRAIIHPGERLCELAPLALFTLIFLMLRFFTLKWKNVNVIVLQREIMSDSCQADLCASDHQMWTLAAGTKGHSFSASL